MTPDDLELTNLLRRVAGKDEAALAELHHRTKLVLAIYIRRIIRDVWIAEEVLQDVYRHIWLNASSYQADRGTPAAWLYMISRSRALDTLRRNQNDGVMQLLDHEPAGAPPRDAELEQLRIRQHALVRDHVAALPASHREMIRLAFFEGYSHAEIAGETGLPLGTVKGRIRTALVKLRRALPQAAFAEKEQVSRPVKVAQSSCNLELAAALH